MDLNKAFGKRLRELRESALLTQRQLAARAKMDPKYVGAIERGERNITLFNVERLRAALNVRPTELFRFDDHQQLTDGQVDSKILLNLLDKCDKITRTHVLNLVKQVARLSTAPKKG